ncbi:MAG: hypothetical protein JXR94_09760 [Candidatus Hydrogenedentes bacterium]|nr:hypothetical protein [Candidatus Hydrogenedentota bacterium]
MSRIHGRIAAPRTARWPLAALLPALLAALGGFPAPAAQMAIHPDRPNAVEFPAQNARFVRLVITATSGSSQPCIDEIEVYAPGSDTNLARDGKPAASSCLSGYAIHRTEHLNDGLYGNAHSWIAAGTGEEWVQIELPEPASIGKVVFSRDRDGAHRDRVPEALDIQLSADGQQWQSAAKVTGAVYRVRGPGAIPAPPPPPDAAAGMAHAAPTPAAVLEDVLGFANLALAPLAKAAASSALEGHAIHRIEHLNDGRTGNDCSWVSQGEPCWAEVDLGAEYWVYRVGFGSDRSGQYADRAATAFSILTATSYAQDTAAPAWHLVHRRARSAPARVRTEVVFEPVRARWVRIAVEAANSPGVRIDEIEVFGQAAPIPPDALGTVPPAVIDVPRDSYDEALRLALLGEEHAWLKAYGRADLSARLVPYNGRVREFPSHVGDDAIPLPPLSAAPVLDGSPGDRCWLDASRGAVRVADPLDFDHGPLVTCSLTAGCLGDDLFLCVEADRFLSSHIAVVSGADWQGCGVVVYSGDRFVFNAYSEKGALESSTPLDGAADEAFTRCELRLPLALFPGCREAGLRVGLGMGGRHTGNLGRFVNLAFSSLALAQEGACLNRTFRVRLAAAPGGAPVVVEGNAPGLTDARTLAPGEATTLEIPANRGPIGPEFDLTVREQGREPYTLHLFRYDPLERALSLMAELADRLDAKGLDVSEARAELARFRTEADGLASRDESGSPAERELFFALRQAKRRLFYRDPDLAPAERVLFVKRLPFEPSHNYSTCFDAPFRPGGGVFILDLPRSASGLDPRAARVTRVFDAGGGIVRNPMADYEAATIYFGYRPSEDGYYHIMSIKPDGTGLTQLTDGPFHDYWPCPLPDGGLAFIATRCTSRALCWRPQSAVLFRMDADGGNIEPLSLANLTEWAPSVMNDGRIIWTRWEYLDKGADFGHTLWSIRPDGSYPELVFGNDIIQPNGYANGREVPGTREICCTLISHFGDLNGPIALLDIDKGRFSPSAITSITPEVPWPGQWPNEECFRDPVPLARDYFLCSHAPQRRFALFIIDRFGNRELLYADPAISSMCPTLFRATRRPPVLAGALKPNEPTGEFFVSDVYRGLEPAIERGRVKYIRVVQEVRHNVDQLPNGEFRHDHPAFMQWYASPVDVVNGPFGWPTYVAKAPLGLVPVEPDGSARFIAPAGKVLYFQALDDDFTELQRMRSVVQLQPGERRSCIGCHESRQMAPPLNRRLDAMAAEARQPEAAVWGGRPLAFAEVVQPVLDAHCVRCHDDNHAAGIDLTAALDANRAPASYRSLIQKGLVHYVDCGWNSGGFEKREPLTFGTAKSRLWEVLNAGHHEVELTRDEVRRIKTWIDMNCPLWPDYVDRTQRPDYPGKIAQAE